MAHAIPTTKIETAVKTIIDLPPDLLETAAAGGISLPDLITRLLRRHFGQVYPEAEAETDALDWRDELL